MERTPDDPNNEPTQMADYEYRGGGNYSEPAAYSSEYREPTGGQPAWSQPPEPPPTPWYLKPFALIGWGVLTAILLAALVWGMVRLVNKDTDHPAPATSTVSSTTSAPAGEAPAPNPPPAAPEAPADENPPPATTTEAPAPSTETPTSTEAPTSTTPSTAAPTTTAPTTTAAPTTTTAAPTTTQAPATTTGAAQPPSEIVIPLPPGL